MDDILFDLTFDSPYAGKENDLILAASRYMNGRLALELFDLDHLPFMRVTVNLPDAPLGPDEIAVKNYSENTGMEYHLAQWGVIEGLPHAHVRSGFVQIPVYQITEDFKEKLRRANV